MAWPEGVTPAIFKAMQAVYRKVGVLNGTFDGGFEASEVMAEFQELVSGWCVQNPQQVRLADQDEDPEFWAIFLMNRMLWVEALLNLERRQEQIPPDIFESYSLLEGETDERQESRALHGGEVVQLVISFFMWLSSVLITSLIVGSVTGWLGGIAAFVLIAAGTLVWARYQ